MVRVKVLLLAVIALGLAGWAVSAVGGSAPAAVAQADAQLERVERGVEARVHARSAAQRAVAAELTSDPALIDALARVADGDGPSLDDAPALRTALEQALAKLPESDRAYAAAALATPKGAIAVVGGNTKDAFAAASFTWLDQAVKAGGAGTQAQVAGHAVHVYAREVLAVTDGKAAPLGTLAVAYDRGDEALAALTKAIPGLTWVRGGKAVASSDPTHAALAAKVTAAGHRALATARPGHFMGIALPLSAATTVQARAFKVPGVEGLAVVTADLSAVVGAVAQAQKTGLMALLGIAIAAVLFIALVGGAAAPREDAADARDPAPAPRAEPAFESAPPAPAPQPAPEPEPLFDPAPQPAPEPEPLFDPAPPPAAQVRPPSAPPPAPASVAGFDELFGPSAGAPAVVPLPPGRAETVVGKPAPAPAPAPVPSNEVERTGLMSRDVLASLAAQSAVPLPPARSAPVEESTRVVQVPTALLDQSAPSREERTTVSNVSAELLRAAAGVAPAGGLSAEEQHFQEVFREFIQTRERCGEPPENLAFDKFSAKLRKNKEQLIQKYACKSVRFQVYVKEGKAALKATPVRDA